MKKYVFTAIEYENLDQILIGWTDEVFVDQSMVNIEEFPIYLTLFVPDIENDIVLITGSACVSNELLVSFLKTKSGIQRSNIDPNSFWSFEKYYNFTTDEILYMKLLQ